MWNFVKLKYNKKYYLSFWINEKIMDSKVAKNNDGFLKSPLNYTGNKYRILDQIIKYFPMNFVNSFLFVLHVGLRNAY